MKMEGYMGTNKVKNLLPLDTNKVSKSEDKQFNRILDKKTLNEKTTDNEGNLKKVESSNKTNKNNKVKSHDDKSIGDDSEGREQENVETQNPNTEYINLLNMLIDLINNIDLEEENDELSILLEGLTKLEVISKDDFENLDLINKHYIDDESEDFKKMLIEEIESKIFNVKEGNETISLDLTEKNDYMDILKLTDKLSKTTDASNMSLEEPDNPDLEVLFEESEEYASKSLIETNNKTVEKSMDKSSETHEDKEDSLENNDSKNNSFGLDLDIRVTENKEFLLGNAEETSNLKSLNEQEIINQIAEKIDFKVTEDISEIKLSLKPKILGDVLINLEVVKGEVSAKIFVENEKVKQIIENNIVFLQDEIEDTGMEIKTFEVFVGSNTDYNQDNNQSGYNFFNKNKKGQYKNKIGKISNDLAANYESTTLTNEASLLMINGQGMDLQV